jgi:exonuclease III
MRILGWNCRGICNTSTVQALRALVKGRNPQLIFLCETKASESRLQSIACSLGFSEHLIVAAHGRSGGVSFVEVFFVGGDSRIQFLYCCYKH